MIKYAFGAVALIAAAVFLFSPEEPSVFSNIGYFKDDDQRRVFLYHTRTRDDAAIKEHAARQAHTDGKLTVVGYTSAGCTEADCRSEVTLAKEFQQALTKVKSSTLSHIVWHMPNGQLNVIRCASQPVACAP